MERKTYYTDGKSIQQLKDVPAAWTTLVGKEQDDEGLKKLQKSVPWLYRGLRLRMNAVASVPFVIYDGENEWDNSEQWENKLGWWPNPRMTLMQTEGAITLFGKSYLLNERNRVKTLGLRYMFPLTIKEVIDPVEGLIGFERKLPSWPEPKKFEVEDFIYFWDIDPFVEFGPPESSPATAAISAAGVLWNVDDFASAFFERGAIKATILSVPQGTIESERQRLKKWWQRAIQGKNFATEVVNADAVKSEVIGEGIKELENVELTSEKREDISTALGIPQSKLFSTAATDSNRVADEKSFYKDTIEYECKFIEEVMNEQVLKAEGKRMQFQLQTLEIFQEDEVQRSGAFLNYVSAVGKDKAGIVAEMLGLDLPEGFEYDDLNSEVVVPDFTPQEMRDETRDEDKEEERGQFRRWAKKRKSDDWGEFEFHHLNRGEQKALMDEMGESPLIEKITEAIDVLRAVQSD